MNTKLYKETLKRFPRILCRLENFDKPASDNNIKEELQWILFMVENDGWENHLENYQQKRTLKSLLKICT